MYYVYELAISGEEQKVGEFYTKKEAKKVAKMMNNKYNNDGYVYYVEGEIK